MLTQVVAGRVYDFSHAVGRLSPLEGAGFNGHNCVAIGKDNVVYISNRGSEKSSVAVSGSTPGDMAGVRIGKFHIGTTPGDEEWLLDFGNYGTDPGYLIWPAGLALDSQENVYVTDEWLNRISVFDKDGNLLRVWGTPGGGDGEINRPSGIAIDHHDDLYIVDTLSHRVQKFTTEGNYLAQWGNLGSGEGEFNSPWGITVDHEGYVYVVDHKNHRVQKFTPEGEYITEYGNYGTGPGQLKRPSDVDVDPDGDIYVCDWANNRVQIFAPDGKFLTSLLGDAQEISKWAQVEVETNPDWIKARRKLKSLEPEWRFALPVGLAFDREKYRLIVTDTQRWRLQVYNKLKEYEDPGIF